MDSKWKRIGKKVKFATIATVFLLVGLIGLLLWKNYISQTMLRVSTVKQLRYETEKLSLALGQFYTERKIDLVELAEGHEISIFFESKALGMSMRYGLRACLDLISDTFEKLMARKTFRQNRIYTRIVFIDGSGELLVDCNQNEPQETPAQDWKKYLTPQSSSPVIITEHQGLLLRVLISVPYFFKNRYAGQIIATVSTQHVETYLARTGNELSRRIDGIVCGQGLFHIQAKKGVPPRFFDMKNFRDKGISAPFRFDMTVKGEGRQEMVFIQVPIEGSPFSLATIIPVAEVFGSAAPWHLPLAMGVLAVLILTVMAGLWRVNNQNIALNARIDEATRQKHEIEAKNRQLETEIRERKRVEEELNQYREDLEQIVKNRTRELEQAQKELISRAMEAGRCQMSAMVLHNIGNAITPVTVSLDTIKSSRMSQVLNFLKKCYLDIKNHAPDAPCYIYENPRGRDVFAYMGNLIDFLKEFELQQNNVIEKMSGAVTYISEILTAQQNYAGREQEMKEITDLNPLILDILRILAGVLESRNIRVKKDLHPELPRVLIDKNRLMQVITNLVKNAYEAMDAWPEAQADKILTIKTDTVNGRVMLHVVDSGIGIDSEQMARIFTYGASSKGSTGFGLNYCKLFVESNHGVLKVSSPGARKGTTVTVDLEALGYQHV
ncbi:MAG: GHKL domain-containing protein [Proteobacteria bacterium]|nr:GHKL domain-containing protein [Pseudomonadota bacterium]